MKRGSDSQRLNVFFIPYCCDLSHHFQVKSYVDFPSARSAYLSTVDSIYTEEELFMEMRINRYHLHRSPNSTTIAQCCRTKPSRKEGEGVEATSDIVRRFKECFVEVSVENPIENDRTFPLLTVALD